MKYLFKLGHQPEISKAEIFSVFEKKGLWCGIINQNENNLFLSAEMIDPKEFMSILGGTILIAEKIESEGSDEVEKIVNYLTEAQPKGKIEFALSGTATEELLMTVKNKLKEKGRSARFVKIKNTASIKYNNLVEFGTHIHLSNQGLFVTKAIQPFEKMKRHGRDRPEVDPESGMLPPKLARILINLSQANKTNQLLDPFCGSGTILMEAASMGYKDLIGNDKDSDSIEASRKNLEWIKEIEQLEFEHKLLNYSTEEISEQLKNKVDCIVTEPFLGKPRTGKESKSILNKRKNELRRLYIDTFYEVSDIIAEDGVVVFIIPAFRFEDGWLRIDCISELKQAGFKPTPFKNQDYLFYSRGDQLVGREIWKFIPIDSN